MSNTATAFAPRAIRVPPPTYTQRPSGLFSVAQVVDFTDAHEANGAEVEVGPYAAAHSYVDGCDPAEDRVKVLPDRPDYVLADPVTVYAGWDCAPASDSPENIEVYSRAALINGEERALEAFLATGESTNGVPTADPWPTSTWDTTTGLALAVDLGAAEALLARLYGGQGVVHVPAAILPLMGHYGLVEARGNRLLTPSGNLLTANPYLDGDGTTAEALVTGSLTIRRGPIVAVGDFTSMDRRVNRLMRLVERTSVIVTDFILPA